MEEARYTNEELLYIARRLKDEYETGEHHSLIDFTNDDIPQLTATKADLMVLAAQLIDISLTGLQETTEPLWLSGEGGDAPYVNVVVIDSQLPKPLPEPQSAKDKVSELLMYGFMILLLVIILVGLVHTFKHLNDLVRYLLT